MAPLVAIFWDYENCRPPINMSGFKIADRVKSVAQAYGQISLFKAYVDVSFEYSAPNTKAVLLHSELQCSGITLAHCPHNGKKDVVDKMMLVDMMAFAMDQPAPNTVTIVVISGDGDFSYGISTLKMQNFNMVVVASEFSANLHLLAQSSESLLWQDILVDQASNQNLNPCFGAQSDVSNALNTSQTPNTYSQASYTALSISHSHISSVTKKSFSSHSGSECFLRRTRYRNFTQLMRPKSVYNVFSRKALHSHCSSPPVPISGSVYHRSRRPSTSVPPLQSTVNNVPRTLRRTQKLVEPSKASSASKSSAASHIAEVPASSHFQFNVKKPCLQWKSSEKQADKSTQVFPSVSTSSTSSLENKLFAESSVSENKSIKDCFVTSEELQPNDVKNEHETPSEVATTDVVACVDTANVSTASCALDQVQTGVSNVTPSTSALKPQKSNLSITHTSENQKLSSSKGGPPESPTEDRLSEIMPHPFQARLLSRLFKF